MVTDALLNPGDAGRFTTTEKFLALVITGVPLSATCTVNKFVVPPCAMLGHQLKIPLLGLMLAPAGGVPARLKLKICGGAPTSVAEFVRFMGWHLGITLGVCISGFEN